MNAPVKFAAIGIDHRHIYGMAANIAAAGGEFVGWQTDGTPNTVDGFIERFANVPRAASVEDLLNNPEINLILLSGIPAERAAIAIRAMEAGKDVLSDKPGCTDFAQLAALKACVEKTGRIWSIDFSERFEVPAATRAAELVAEGAIGKVIQTVGLGPHRLNKATRPDWFFERASYGGIITDLASHQIDQFLFFTGVDEAEITLAHVANYANPETPGLQDFGEVALRAAGGAAGAHGYIRVDWYTPDALPSWGDGRLTILGTQGYIELRKYVDVGQNGTDHLVLVNGSRCEKIDASHAGLPFFGRLLNDISNRTETAMTQRHAFTVCALSLKAQAMAEGRA
ncbi:MAG: Gfo/Idh/MocA family oxidoreductase [Paracoccaceae bacterium]